MHERCNRYFTNERLQLLCLTYTTQFDHRQSPKVKSRHEYKKTKEAVLSQQKRKGLYHIKMSIRFPPQMRWGISYLCTFIFLNRGPALLITAYFKRHPSQRKIID
ncbi:unnamed protein product [Spirodela intermedia]|uniref:Uncharacterized protein n=1 Tax=Spirodela intermedia TaxID=51605 RepID=A0A7I8L5R2_SPIIN|nr:unnamed protein product [Spirodela intermedia]